MKTTSSLLLLSATLLLTAHFSPLAAQYNPPPPPEQANTGEPSDQQMAQVPPPDQGGPGPGDDSVPPPDGGPQGDSDQPGPDQGDANFQTFYDNLSSQGNWVQTDNYGYVFQPNVEDPDWAPYTDGRWVYTDEGWTWASNDSEPWGWATYHYGRWANLDGYGWVWVPGYTWAPAWVSWRYGDGYCGWAPLPPDTFVGIDVGGVGAGFVFHIGGDCDTAYDIGPRYYNFIPVGYLGSRDYRHHFADRNNNFAIINNTRNVTNIVVNNRRGSGRFGRVSVGGPDIATVDAQSSNRIQRAQLSRSNRVGNASLSGNRFSVFAPRVNSANAATFRPSHVAGNVANANINSGANINQPLQVNQRVHGRSANQAQIAAAQNVHFSTGSHVATPDLHPNHAFNRPLTSFPRSNNSVTPNASVQSNRSVNNAAVNGSANGVHPQANFTGQNANQNGGQFQHHEHANTQPQVQQSVVTPQVQQQPVVHPQANAQGQQFQHHQHEQQVQQQQQAQVQQQQVHQQQTQQVQQQQQAQVQQQQVHQQQVQQVQHQDLHPQAEVQHQQVEHQQQQPAEHHDAAPEHREPQHQESHPQPQAQHHDAPQQQQHNNGGGGNNNGGNKDKGKDDHH